MPRRLRGGTWRRRGPSLVGGGIWLCPTEILGELECPFDVLCFLRTLSHHLPFLRQRAGASQARRRALQMARNLDAWWPAFFAHLSENLSRFMGVGTKGFVPLGASRGHVRLMFDDHWKAWLWRLGADVTTKEICEAWLLLFDAFLEDLSRSDLSKSALQLFRLQGVAKRIQAVIDSMSLFCGGLNFWQFVIAVATVPVDATWK